MAEQEPVRVLRDVKLVGEIVLDPRYDPPWPGAGIKAARETTEDNDG
ncbi:MAG TPA: hypothetical protein VGL33_30650 [Streptosporangiaceae bacterium]|jgi:hypothetical protein